MKDEISAAVTFLIRLVEKNLNLNNAKVEEFKNHLNDLLMERFQNHWFPEKPCKGQAYRCIRVNETERRDPILQRAAQQCGLKYEDLKLPSELTLWVDPQEVCCRFGEHQGSFCTVASFKSGSKENFVHRINIEELEKISQERARKASMNVVNGRRKWKKKNNGEINQNKNYLYNHNFNHQQMHGVTSPISHQYPVYRNGVYGSTSPPSAFFPYSTSPPQLFYNSYSCYSPKFSHGFGHCHSNNGTTYILPHQNWKNDQYYRINKSLVKV
ncbi:maternal B9.10 protein-like [Limulus polyphemus]|uniref:Maternal B9.10 protein-like n=1 Tax=Limulus polyphemus TaxID=6850 RepID=A0ABM1B755_LIMPO|nr:maternal B9.10 protein-like [Limulus polyphemus]